MSSVASSHRLNWRLLVRYLRPFRRQMLVLAAILAVLIGLQLATPLAASRFIDVAVADGSMETLVNLAVITIALALLAQGVAVLETWVAERISWGATNALREALAAHLLHLDAAFHHAHTPGELIERIDGDIGTLARLFSRFTVYVVGNVLLVAGILILLYALDWRVGLGLTLFVAAAVATMLRLRAAATPYSAAERQASAGFYGFLGEHLAGLEDVRALGARGFVMRRCAELMRAWLAARMQAQMRGYGMVAASQGLFGLGMAFALALSAMLFRDGVLTIGAIFLIFRYTEMLRHPTEQIRNEIQDVQQAGASLGRIEDLLGQRSRIVDGPVSSLPPGPLPVELDRVWFGYEPGVPVLHEVSLRLEPQRVLGILGRTGSGKTTLTRLLLRFYDPDCGVVRLGGVDLRSVSLSAIRAHIGLVTQEAQLFNASVRDNLTLFDDSVPDGRLIDILESLGMGEWLRALPAELDTWLGAGGIGLSAGQMQTLACARVLLRDPDVVILDEPSSKLDPATERPVHRVFARLLAGRTGVIVAHRLSTLALADDILILEQGRVLESGPRLGLAADPTTRYAAMLRQSVAEVGA